jgi:ubiquinone biosynthesis monooxygenase Coq7
MSEKAALACTDAVETVIDRHYGDQLDELADSDHEFAADIAAFRAEELEHRDSARDAGAGEAFGYPLLTAVVRGACRLAIGLSKRI